MRKILIVSPSLNYGGAERVAALWAEGFVEQGYQVFFVTNLEEEEAYSLNERILLLSLTNKKGNKIIRYIGAVNNLRKYYTTYHPDIIIGVMYACSILAKLADLGLNIPVINTEHNSFERPKIKPMSNIDKLSKFWLNYCYNGITVLTEADRNIIKNKFKHIYVLPNPTFLHPLSKIPPKNKSILAAGRVDAWFVKGFDVLIKSWKKIQDLNDNVNDDDKLRDWWLKIAGDGKKESFEYLMNLLPDAEWVFNDNDDDNDNKSAVWRSEKYRIEFLGFRKDIEELYKKSSIFVLSSRYEGFGLVLIEAMSQGCAPVACDYKGRQAEILSPSGDERRKTKDETSGIEITENGILCEPDNVEALASAIRKMIKDDNYRERIQHNATTRSKDFIKEKIMNKWNDIFRDQKQ